MRKIQKVEFINPRNNHGLHFFDKAIITDISEVKVELKQMEFNQMVEKKNGIYVWHPKMPVDYFFKKHTLERNGWYTFHHYDYWVNDGMKNKDYCGLRTEIAFNKLMK